MVQIHPTALMPILTPIQTELLKEAEGTALREVRSIPEYRTWDEPMRRSTYLFYRNEFFNILLKENGFKERIFLK